MKQRACLILCLLSLFACGKPDTLFREISPESSGIQFANMIPEDESLNVLNYEYIYNGGGIGVGDFNRDSLPDLYFTANRSGNKLYLNKGNLRFEDVTQAAAVDGLGKWSKGVAVIDINNDQWPDLYVCAAVLPDSNARRNMLYVNQGVPNGSTTPVFKEMAEAYGLANTANTHMAAFFDYDNDGDLDVYLLNNDLDGTYPNEFRPIIKDGRKPNTDKLLQNNFSTERQHPVFTDVSQTAGITIEGYGLGVAISDLNQDGWKDIYISNDYLSNNIIYINNRDGSFTDHAPEILKHSSKNAMGNDIADMNNDGLQDIIETDMMPDNNYRQKMMYSDISYQTFQNSERFGYIYQYPRNTLQLNRGIIHDSIDAPAFSDIAYWAGVAQTDWSWAPLLADADNDGWRDLVISNGLPRDMSDLDFMAYRKNAYASTPLNEVLAQLPAVQIHNYMYRNQGNLQFSDMSREWGMLTPTFSTGMAYADLDRDGDLDFVFNNTNMKASLYENTQRQQESTRKNHFVQFQLQGSEQNRQGLGTWIRMHCQGNQQVYEHSPYRGYLSSMDPLIHFGLGTASVIDSVIVSWPDGRSQKLTGLAADRVHVLDVKQAGSAIPFFPVPPESSWFRDISKTSGLDYGFPEIDFIDFNIQRLIPHKLTQNGPSVAVGDLNGDGRDDVVTGGSSPFSATVFLQQADGRFTHARINKTKIPQLQDDAGLLLFDADRDGDLDLYIASGGAENEPQTKPYTDHFYTNDGSGHFSESSLSMPNNRTSKSCLAAHDYDGDGDLDLFLGGRVIPGSYPLPASSYIYRNDSRAGTLAFTDVTRTLAPGLQGIGLTTAALWSDIDNDNQAELLVATEWGPIHILRYRGNGWQKQVTALDSLKGWWNSIVPADLDNDGDMDYVAGNYGNNGFLQPTAARPIRAYVYDFDKNGNPDAVFSSFRKSSFQDSSYREFPLAGRDDFLREMSALKVRFPNYASYARAPISQVFEEGMLAAAKTFTTNTFTTVWIENKGNFQFEVHALPAEAQWAPVYGILARDFDGDGNIDLVLNGNEYAMSPGLGRYDAFFGLVLKGNGAGGFQPCPIRRSGFYVPGNGKALADIRWAGSTALLAMENTGRLRAFAQVIGQGQTVPIAADEVSAIIHFRNGKKRKEEFPVGSGFLTQQAKFLSLTPDMTEVQVMHRNGQERTIRP